MGRDLSEQLELAIRAVDNLTRVHYAFKDGRSFNWFDVTPDGAYDDFIIPTSVLGHDPEKQKHYYNALSHHLAGYIEELISMEAILKDVYQTSYLNNTAYIKSRDNFSEHSRKINHYRSLFHTEIVWKAMDLWNNEINSFTNFNMSFNLQKYNILKIISQLNKTTSVALDSINNQVLPIVAKALNYVKDVSLSKYDLANSILSVYFQDIFTKSVTNTIEVLKSRGKDLEMSWQSLKVTILHIWTTFISDATTKEFYTALMEDLFLQSGDVNFSEPILEMAGITDSDNGTESITFENLVHILNTDISVMHLSNKSQETIKLFDKYMQTTDIVETLKNLDTSAFQAFTNIRDNMEDFLKMSDISGTFLRCVTYLFHSIQKQVVNDVFIVIDDV